MQSPLPCRSYTSDSPPFPSLPDSNPAYQTQLWNTADRTFAAKITEIQEVSRMAARGRGSELCGPAYRTCTRRFTIISTFQRPLGASRVWWWWWWWGGGRTGPRYSSLTDLVTETNKYRSLVKAAEKVVARLQCAQPSLSLPCRPSCSSVPPSSSRDSFECLASFSMGKLAWEER